MPESPCRVSVLTELSVSLGLAICLCVFEPLCFGRRAGKGKTDHEACPLRARPEKRMFCREEKQHILHQFIIASRVLLGVCNREVLWVNTSQPHRCLPALPSGPHASHGQSQGLKPSSLAPVASGHQSTLSWSDRSCPRAPQPLGSAVMVPQEHRDSLS